MSLSLARTTARSRRTALASDLLPLCDLVCLLIVAWFTRALGTQWAQLGLTSDFGRPFQQAAVVATVLAPFMLYDKCFGSMASRGQTAALIRSHALRFALFTGAILALAAMSHTLASIPRSWLAIGLVTSALVTSLTRIAMARHVRWLGQRGELAETIAIVGAGPVADRLVRTLAQTRTNAIQLLGVFDDKIIGAVPSATQSSGSLAKLIELGKSRHIDWILLTLPPTAEDRVLAIVQRLKSMSIPIGLCPPHVGLAIPFRNVDFVGDSVPVNMLADKPIHRWRAVTKSGEDIVIGSIATLLLLPVLAIVALAIKLNSPGPVIFTQRRHAVDNREFDIYKFRTMRWNPAAANQALQQTSRQDTRITSVGRFLRASSLDELPQLFNVLKGEMSLVGPRPHAVDMRTENRLGPEITDTYPHRHRVKPGMTGWSQVNGARGATDTTAQLRRRVELDLHYIDNWSLLLDLKILALTSREVLKRTNAY